MLEELNKAIALSAAEMIKFNFTDVIDGLEYKDLLNKVIDLCMSEYKNKRKKIKSFESNILENFNGTKGVKK